MIVIVSHFSPDFDAVASMVAAAKLYPDCVKVITGVPESNVSKFLDSFSGIFDFKTEKDIDLNDITSLIIVDTQSPNRIGKFQKLIGSKGVKTYVYDHHPKKNTGFEPDYSVYKTTGATTTILIQSLLQKGINLKPEEATLMMLGIYEETGAFRNVSTTPDDLDAAAFLLRFGADVTVVSNHMTQEMDIEHTRLLSQFLDTLNFVMINGFKIYFMTASFDYYLRDVSFLINKVRDIENIGIIFALIEMEGKVYMIARSNNIFVDVGDTASRFGGGGHHSAASAVLRGVTLYQAQEQITGYLRETLKSEYRAEDIMSYPVKFINPDTSVKDAKEYMVKANFNTLPIIDNEKIAGIVTRMDLDKALFHKLGDYPVRHYMTTDLITINKNTILSDIQTLFAKNNIGRIPVVEDGKIAGIITRTDLLRAIHDNYLSKTMKDVESPHYRLPKNMARQIESAVSPPILKIVREIGGIADSYNINAYLAGGFVRDILLGIENLDIDVVVEHDGIKFVKALSDFYGAQYVTHEKFSTGVLTHPSGIKIDVSTARLEYYEFPGALPIIELASIKQDLSRRDFTINAMAIRINKTGFGELIDFFCGQQDLKNKIVRVLHNLSFVEDPTRIFRAVRFEQRFGFHIDKHTETLIRHAVQSNMFGSIAFERVRAELEIMLSENKPVKALNRMYEFDELRFIDPSFSGKAIRNELFVRIEDSITWFNLSFFKVELTKWLIYFMGLVSKLPYQAISQICGKMRMRKKDASIVLSTITRSNLIISALSRKIRDNSFLYRVLKNLPYEGLIYIMALSNNSVVKEKIAYYLMYLKDVKLSFSGNDIIKRGLKPCPEFKTILKILLMEKIDGKFNSAVEESDRLDKLVDAYKKKKYNNQNSES